MAHNECLQSDEMAQGEKHQIQLNLPGGGLVPTALSLDNFVKEEISILVNNFMTQAGGRQLNHEDFNLWVTDVHGKHHKLRRASPIDQYRDLLTSSNDIYLLKDSERPPPVEKVNAEDLGISFQQRRS